MNLRETEPSPPDSADPSTEPDRPRLGIGHLMLWTACVAVYLPLWLLPSRIASGGVPPPEPTFGTASLGALHSIGSGAAWAGLALWAARRRRGLPFPRHPGEYLLVVLGVTEGIRLLGRILTMMFFRLKVSLIIRIAVGIGGLGLYALVMLWPVFAVKSRRWRTFFLTCFVLCVVEFFSPMILAMILPAATVGFWQVLQRFPYQLLIGAVLISVVLKDRSGGRRHPWTHWAGVGAQLWFIAVDLLMRTFWCVVVWFGT